jgi:hypothetical protein
MLGTAPASARRVPAKYRFEPTFDKILLASIYTLFEVAGVVDQSEVNISLKPFCANTPALFVRTNGGLPVKVSEFIVRFVFVPYALAYRGSFGLAYVPFGSVAIIDQEDKVCKYRDDWVYSISNLRL